MSTRLECRSLVDGTVSAEVLYANVELSFWGGINPAVGEIIDQHHPLCGQLLHGRILTIPGSRGSCTGSMNMLEMMLNRCAPAALIFEQLEEIATLGVMVAEEFYDLSIPVIVLSMADFKSVGHYKFATISGTSVVLSNDILPTPLLLPKDALAQQDIMLSAGDHSMLAGEDGRASQVAMRLLLRFAAIQGATELLSVSQVHIDACTYIGPASLRYAETMLSMGAKFVVPATMNSISIDKRRWRELGMDPELSPPAEALANAYLAMGAQPSFTCAPYSLSTVPAFGENIGWGESNAVIFANSILGAKTQKYPDFIDSCIAVTGRAPAFGVHNFRGRTPQFRVQVGHLTGIDDSIYPVLGYIVGRVAQNRIPIVYGLEDFKPAMGDLKAFCAAFATTCSAPMFHINKITPESAEFDAVGKSLPSVEISVHDINECHMRLTTARDPSVGLVSLGNPHFLLDEFERLAELCRGRKRSKQVNFIITTNRTVEEQAVKAGYLEVVKQFGGLIITDTCWCMLTEPVIRKSVKNIATNSAKYAHYGPGLVKRGIHFGSLVECVNAACEGRFPTRSV